MEEQMELILKEIKLADCILYPEEILDNKIEWLRKKFPFFLKLKASLQKDGMINPIWVFEQDDGKYRIAKGCCRSVAWGDLGHKTVMALIAPIGMPRSIANNLFYNSDYVKEIPMVNPETFDFLVENGQPLYFPKGF